MSKKRISKQQRMTLIIGAAGIVLVFGFGFAHLQSQWRAASVLRYESASLFNPSAEGAAAVGGSFTLVNQEGKTVTERDFAGKYMFATFGFTYCPDVCPTKLQAISLAMDVLGPEAARVQPLFITIDPARDTPKQLKEYVSLYHSNIQGLTGTPAQIAEVAKKFKVYYKRGEDVGDGNYMMDHSTQIYFLAPDGTALEIFMDEATAPAMAESIKRHLTAAPTTP